jgi:chromosome partitioning protein
MSTRLAFFIDKGGTGKTTSAAHLGVALAEEGLDVLLVDLAGKQGDLSKVFGVWEDYRQDVADGEAWPNISTVFDDAWPTIADKLGDQWEADLIHTTDEGVDLIPAHPGLDTLDDELASIDDAEERYTRLEEFLDEYVDPLGYDVVAIDLPGLTNNISYSGLWAAGNVVVPVEMGPFEADQAAALREDLDKLDDSFAVEIALAMVLPNKVDTRTTLAEEYLAAFAEEYPEAIAPSYVPYSQDIRNATEQGHTAFALEAPSTTATRALEAYREAAEALVDRLGGVDA